MSARYVVMCASYYPVFFDDRERAYAYLDSLISDDEESDVAIYRMFEWPKVRLNKMNNKCEK